MKVLPLLAAAVFSIKEGVVLGFSIPPSSTSPSRSSSAVAATSRSKLHHHSAISNKIQVQDDEPSSSSRSQQTMQRRTLLSNFVTAASSTLLILPTTTPAANAAPAIPSVTSSEFDTILKDSAKSILSVELSGPKSETAIVKLVDGTTFTISDLVESSTDPRSPLKLVARCRLYNIPVRNTGLISAVSGDGAVISASGKKKKSYMNARVQEAERKNEERRERMAEDERERLEELYKLEEKDEGFLKE